MDLRSPYSLYGDLRLCMYLCVCVCVLLLLTAIKLSLDDSSPYTSTDKTNKNTIYINQTIQ